ncbi:hypothetical protein NQ315_010993 [Exocentrus adspersus]|uniref:Integrase catalytic domain-containing protein n=1 Tax=Exocentrus adspersus TaxID=1586481 RepID=A0AAV8V5G3_9CUCU|nr:hypothetical protein NQ315_010993 [Exocentrus adspersus]
MSSIKEGVVNELHKPGRRNFKRRHVIVKGLNDLIQIDLVEMIPYARVNKGYRYVLIVINVFSKFVWAEPVKRKTGKDVTAAMKNILSQMKAIPRNCQSDMGKEFYNKDFQDLITKFRINHYSTFSTKKASVVERVNRTLKNLMWKQFSLRGNYKWIDILQDIVTKYNNTKHKTIRLKPSQVNNRNAKRILQTTYSYLKTSDPKRLKFKVGDHVRISKYRELFSKGYTPNWSNEVFSVIKVKNTNPRTYLLKDENEEPILGGFYSEELQKTAHPQVHLIEKVIKKKGNKLLVKWLGMNHTSWINKNEIV